MPVMQREEIKERIQKGRDGRKAASRHHTTVVFAAHTGIFHPHYTG